MMKNKSNQWSQMWTIIIGHILKSDTKSDTASILFINNLLKCVRFPDLFTTLRVRKNK